MSDSSAVELKVQDYSVLKLDDTAKIAMETGSYSEYKMKCEVYGVSPKSEEVWKTQHCGGIVVEIDMDKITPPKHNINEVSSLRDLTIEFNEDTSLSPLFMSWLKTRKLAK